MIKNKKYKSFSLIEAMILFLILSLILLAFIPIFLKRPQKAAESDCFGGLRNIKLEYSTPGEYNFTVPRNIASDLTVTIVGAGGGGASPFVQPFSYGHIGRLYSNGNPVPWNQPPDALGGNHGITICLTDLLGPTSNYVYAFGITKTIVTQGGSADCGLRAAGASGRYYPKWRLDNSNSMKTACNGNSVQAGNFISDSDLLPFVPGESFGGNYLTQPILRGGIPPVQKAFYISNSNSAPAGYIVASNWGTGQSCKLNDSNDGYVADGNPGGYLNAGSQKEAVQTLGGGSGLYAKFPLAVDSGIVCNITVGRGGDASGNGENTTIKCGEDDIITAKGGGGASAPTTLLSSPGAGQAGTSSVSDNIPDGAIIIPGTRHNESLERYSIMSGNGADSALAYGGRGACKHIYLSSECIYTDGKPGILGSGGGGASCGESGCGTGGKGGDGVAIVEYLEYCK